MFEKKTPQEVAGHNSGPPNQTYYCGPGLVMDYPLEKLFGSFCFFFLLGSSKAAYILAIWEFVRISSERNKKKYSKRKNTLAKEKVKGMFEKKSLQEAAGHNSGTPKQTYYCGTGLLMDYPLEKLFEWCFFHCVFIRRHIFWKIWHFWEFQVKGTKKIKEKRL